MGPPPGRIVAIIFAACISAFFAFSIGYTTWSVNSSERKWCATLDLLSREQPPPGDRASNPSRAYEQDLHSRFTHLRSQLGCA